MSGSMKASFTLTLNDKLTAGLKNVENAFKGLDELGKKLTLGKLEQGTTTLRTLGREVRDLTGDFHRLSATTERAWTAVKGMASAPLGRLKGFGQKLVNHGGTLQDAAMAVGGVYAIERPMHAYADFDKELRQIAITEGKSGRAVSPEAERLKVEFQKDALASGQSSKTIADAYAELLHLHVSPRLAQELLPIHSRAATAYGVSAGDLGPLVGSLAGTMGIGAADMPTTLAMAALAAKKGRVGWADMSRFMPAISGQMHAMGMTGVKGAGIAFASLETVARNAADPSQAAANYSDFLGAIVSPHAARSFALRSRMMTPESRAALAKYHITGIDLPQLLDQAQSHGVDAQTAVIEALQAKLKGLPAIAQAQVLGAFFPNQQARSAVMSILQNYAGYQKLLGEFGTANPAMFDRDFQTMFSALSTQLDLFTEKMAQVNRRLGQGFAPLMAPVNSAMSGLLSGIHSLDTELPGLGNAVIEVTGAMLAAASALAAAGFIAPAVKSGFGLLSDAWGVVAPFATSPLGLAGGIVAGGVGVADWAGNHGYKASTVDPFGNIVLDPGSKGYAGPEPHPAAAENKLHVVVSADPGTKARVASAPHGIQVDVNPGEYLMTP